jgi:hypothetical protein
MLNMFDGSEGLITQAINSRTHWGKENPHMTVKKEATIENCYFIYLNLHSSESMYLLTYLLTELSPSEKLPIVQPFKNFPAF